MNRVLSFVYGVAAYGVSLVVFVYLAGFLLNVGVPCSIDGPAAHTATVDGSIGGPAAGSAASALAVNLALILLFGLQHSVMARPTFKRWWTRLVPEAIERSTYVLASCVVLAVIFWQWRPMPSVLWSAQSGASAAGFLSLYALGWAIVLSSTFLLNHFDLFGLRQVWLNLLNRPYTRLPFRVPFFYRFVRHPLYVGWMMVFWCAPHMTAGRLLFALGMSAYILVAIYFEERNLLEVHGEQYAEYRRRVPMLAPVPALAGRRIEAPAA